MNSTRPIEIDNFSSATAHKLPRKCSIRINSIHRKHTYQILTIQCTIYMYINNILNTVSIHRRRCRRHRDHIIISTPTHKRRRRPTCPASFGGVARNVCTCFHVPLHVWMYNAAVTKLMCTHYANPRRGANAPVCSRESPNKRHVLKWWVTERVACALMCVLCVCTGASSSAPRKTVRSFIVPSTSSTHPQSYTQNCTRSRNLPEPQPSKLAAVHIWPQ